MRLLGKELAITFKSLTYGLVVLFLGIFLFTQLGSNYATIKEPTPNQASYGMVQTNNQKSIQKQTIANLLLQFDDNAYTTYPWGFLKIVTLSKKDQRQIKNILEVETGKNIINLRKMISSKKENTEINAQTMASKIPIKHYVTKQQFSQKMKLVAKTIGNGSDFSESKYRNLAIEKQNYAGAKARFNDILMRDHVSGAFARYTCDYLGIILALIPIFIVATIAVRDKRSHSEIVIDTKQISTFKLQGIRFVASILLTLAPVLLFSLMPALQSMVVASQFNTQGSLLVFYEYVLGWTLPTIIAVTGLGFMMSNLFNGIISIFTQIVIWLIAVVTSSTNLVGGIGLNLIPRFNALGSTSLFMDIFHQLVLNRIGWLGIGLLCFGINCWLVDRRRKGVLRF